MPKELIVTYVVHVPIPIPDSIPLLPEEENEAGKPWSWYVRWNDLYYLDDKGVEHCLRDPNCEPQEYANWKRPDKTDLRDEKETPFILPEWEEVKVESASPKAELLSAQAKPEL